MKKILFTTSFLSFILFSNAQEKAPKLVCAGIIEFGTIVRGSDGTRDLIVKNEGDGPLIINNVGSSCGCTVPSWPKEPILPGQEAKIQVKYNTYILGKISKSISISSNSSNDKMKYVHLNGEVMEEKK